MWDLVGNPEDRFSHKEAHILGGPIRERDQRADTELIPVARDPELMTKTMAMIQARIFRD